MLNRHEKLAVFNLSIIAVGILLFILVWQTMGISRAYGGFAVFAFMAVGHLVFLRKKKSSEVVEDERDVSIRIKANSGALAFMNAYFIFVSLAVYFTYSDAGVVSVDFFPLFVYIGWAVQLLAFSVTTLVQYRRGTNCGTC
jgi:uncharacterized membrane protein